jgi:ankyrin repeat protein
MVAAFSNSESLLEELLQRGADVDAQSNFGSTALMSAVNFLPKAAERVRVLLRYGANVNVTDKHGRTALSLLEHRLEIPGAAEVAEILRKATV